MSIIQQVLASKFKLVLRLKPVPHLPIFFPIPTSEIVFSLSVLTLNVTDGLKHASSGTEPGRVHKVQ